MPKWVAQCTWAAADTTCPGEVCVGNNVHI